MTGSFSDTSNAYVTVAGGNGGAGSSGAAPGSGGQGGNTALSLSNYTINGTNYIVLGGGAGGAGGNNTTSGTGGAGGTAGYLDVTVGTLTLGTGSSLTLVGNTGGTGGNSTGGTGGAGGNGGEANLSIGAVTMSPGNFMNVTGGADGAGGSGATQGANGNQGLVAVSIGDLEGDGGSISISGTLPNLQVSSGNFSGSLQGNENLQKVGFGSLIIGGANSFTGKTLVALGTLYLDTNGTFGTGQVQNFAYLDFIDNSTAGNSNILNDGVINFMDNSRGGSAQLINNAAATIDFSYNNASTVAGGAMTVGSIAGSGIYDLGRVDLTTGGNNQSTTVSGLIVDGGGNGGTGASLTKVGTGTLALSGINTYTGGTAIDAGTLAVGSSGALGLGLVAVNGGTLARAGTGPLTLLIGGAYYQSSNGALQLNVAGANAASSDSLSVARTSSLNGTLNLLPGSGLTAPALGSSVTILTATSVSGIFQQVDESFSGFRLLPLYLANAVELESINPSFQDSGSTPNQKAIGADLDSLALNPKMDGLMASIGALSNSSFQAAEGQLSPEDFTALYQAGFEGALARTALVDQRMSQLMTDVDNTAWLPGFSSTGTPWFAANVSASQEASMAPSKTSPWGGFVSGNGGFFNVSSDSNAAGYKVTTYGLTGAGADYRLSREMVAGLMVGYGHTDVILGTGGTLTADGGQLGLYGLFYSEGLYTSALVEGGINSYGTTRTGYNGTATGKTQGNQYDGALEMGYQFKSGQMKIGPMGSVQYSNVSMNGFTEQGSQAPLTIPNQSENSLLSRLGARANSQWSLGNDTTLNPMLQLAWEHEYNYQGGTYQAGFGTGDSFTVAGPQVGQDGIMAGAGVEINFAKSLSLSLNYQGEFGRTNLNSNEFGGGVKVGF